VRLSRPKPFTTVILRDDKDDIRERLERRREDLGAKRD
jgi:hypothetical protein